MTANNLFNPALMAKYNTNGPRYTSYPTALEFSDTVDDSIIDTAAATSQRDLSLYVHIPFCHSLCYYCGCNKIITRHQDKADVYLDYLEREMRRRSPYFANKSVAELHLGGGSPSFLTQQQHSRLREMAGRYFNLASDAKLSLEVDPRRFDGNDLQHLASLGYSRLSIGVQDVDFLVQKAINRIQSTAHIADLIAEARECGFTSVNIDLIYGLPHQSADTFSRTLAAAKAMEPDRISLFSYAHLPARFAAQRKIKDEWLPGAADKLNLMKQAISRLTDSGYEMIGMDHFALPDDELAIAKRNATLHRNFQGYTTGAELDLLGLGVTSISAIGHVYSQNPKALNDYYRALDNNMPLTEKGIVLDKDDLLRRDVIMSLMCNLTVRFTDIETTHSVSFVDYFAREIEQLRPFVDDELVVITDNEIVVAEHARLFIRIIAMTFDAYLAKTHHMSRYSRVI